MKELQIALGKMMVKGAKPVDVMEKQIDALQNKVAAGRQNNTLSPEAIRSGNIVVDRMQKQKEILLNAREDLDGKSAYPLLKKDFDGQSSALSKQAKKASESLANVFDFAEEVFGRGARGPDPCDRVDFEQPHRQVYQPIWQRRVLQAQQRAAVLRTAERVDFGDRKLEFSREKLRGSEKL